MGISEIVGKGSTLAVCAALGLTLAGCGGTAAAAKSGSAPTRTVASKTVAKKNSKKAGEKGSKAKEPKGVKSDSSEAKPESAESKETKTDKKSDKGETKRASAKKGGRGGKPSKSDGGSSKPSGSNKSDSGSSKPSGGQNQNQGSGTSGSSSGSDSGSAGSSKPAEPERVWAVVTPAWDEQVYHPAVTHTETQKIKVGVQYQTEDGNLFDNEDDASYYAFTNGMGYSCLPKYETQTVTVTDQEAWTETVHHDAVWGWVNK